MASKQSQIDKDIDAALSNIVMGIGHGFKMIFYGIKKLNSIKNVVFLLVMLAISVLAYVYRNPVFDCLKSVEMPGVFQKIVFIVILCLPLIYLVIIGSSTDRKAKEFYKIFQAIEFKGRDGKYPYFLDMYQDEDKRTIYTFKTSISVGEWRKNQERLETALDCTILQINNKGSKKIVEIISLSSDYKLPTLVEWEDSRAPEGESRMAVGECVMGQVSFDLNKTPHVLVAGETGSGKSVILHVLLWQMILKQAKVIMLDFKGGVEFGLDYEAYGEVITDREQAVKVLEELVKENQLRLQLFRQYRAKNIAEYNEKTDSRLCRIGVFCDEIAEMMDTTGVPKKEREIYEKIKGLLSTLARLSRSTGINMIMGVQRPDANVLTGQIKNNIPVRICGRFADKAASEIVLNTTAAINLPDVKGRFLFLRGNELIEFQAYLFEDSMMHEVYADIGTMLIDQKRTGKAPKYYEQPPINAQEDPEDPDQVIAAVDYGLDRYKDVGNLDFDFDESIEWSVDDDI